MIMSDQDRDLLAIKELNLNEAEQRTFVYNIENWLHNEVKTRSEMWESLLDPRRDIDKECGYPATTSLSARHYKNQFLRMSTAQRVVDVLPKETWLQQPSIFEDRDNAENTEFEDAWDQIGKDLSGMSSWYKSEEGNPVWELLRRIDIISGIGHYGVMLLGFDDGGELNTPLPGFEKGMPDKPIKRNLRLMYARTLDESLAEIVRYNNDSKSPRYGRPDEYLCTLGELEVGQTGIGLDQRTVNVHWSRIIHVPSDDQLDNDNFATPRQRPVYNHLYDLRKLYGGSAEMYWKGALPGLVYTTHPQLGGNVKVNEERVKAALNKYQNTLQRFLIAKGADVRTLSPQVVDPTAQINVHIEAICVCLGIPKRIFMGTERGELASGQDDSTWNDRITERRNLHVNSNIIIPFVDRLIYTGVLPEPKEYVIEWPDLGALSDMDNATLAKTKIEAMTAYIGGQGDSLISPLDVLVEFFGFEEEKAQELLDNSLKHIEEKQAQEMDQQQQAIDAGLAPDPTEPAIDPKTGKPMPVPPGNPFGGKGAQKPGQAPGAPGKPGAPVPKQPAGKTPGGDAPPGKKPPFDPKKKKEQVQNYSPGQARDARGRWSVGGGSGRLGGAKAGGVKPIPEYVTSGLSKQELKLFKDLGKERTTLNKKIKDGTATQADKDKLKFVMENLNSLRDKAKKSAGAGGATATKTESTKKVGLKSEDLNQWDANDGLGDAAKKSLGGTMVQKVTSGKKGKALIKQAGSPEEAYAVYEGYLAAGGDPNSVTGKKLNHLANKKAMLLKKKGGSSSSKYDTNTKSGGLKATHEKGVEKIGSATSEAQAIDAYLKWKDKAGSKADKSTHKQMKDLLEEKKKALKENKKTGGAVNLQSAEDYQKSKVVWDGMAKGQKLSPPQRKAAQSYQGTGYHGINNCLRKAQGCNETQLKKIKELEAGIAAQSGIPKDMTLFRGVSSNTIKKYGGESLKVGTVFQDDGFASTSYAVGPSKSFGNNTLVINAPKGTPGLAMDFINSLKYEKEILLQRGVQYKITKVEKTPIPYNSSMFNYKLFVDVVGFDKSGGDTNKGKETAKKAAGVYNAKMSKKERWRSKFSGDLRLISVGDGPGPVLVENYNPKQPRGADGKWSGGMGGSGGLNRPIPQYVKDGLSKDELKEFGRLGKMRTKLNKKVSDGSATAHDKKALSNVMDQLETLRSKAKGGGTTVTETKKQGGAAAKKEEKLLKKKAGAKDKNLAKDDLRHQMEPLSQDDPNSIAALHKANNLAHYAINEAVKGPIKQIKTHGMKHAEEFCSVKLDGMDFHFNPNDEKSIQAARITVSQMMTFGPLEGNLGKATKGIYFTSQKNKHDAHWAQEYNMPGFKSTATGGDGNIMIYHGESASRGTLAHEAAHNMARGLWGHTSPPHGTEYGKAQKKEKPVSEYGATARAEDFAEAARFYDKDPVYFAKKFPAKAAAMKKLINQPGFKPVLNYSPYQPRDGHGRWSGSSFGGGGLRPMGVATKKTAKKAATSAKLLKEQKWNNFLKTKDPKDAKAFQAAKADGVAIPPAWTNVTYYGKDANVRATGTDAKGRKQRAENPEYRTNVSAKNNERITKKLKPKMDKIRTDLAEKIKSGTANEADKVLYLISKTGFRVGGKGDGKAKVKAYGASTLLKDHVTVKGSKVTFKFPGKKGVMQDHTVDDALIASMVKGKKKGERLFDTNDQQIRRHWRKFGSQKVHDIRHVIAYETAEKVMQSLAPPKNTLQLQKHIKHIATETAKVLGNNPAEALGTYIDPALIKKLKVKK